MDTHEKQASPQDELDKYIREIGECGNPIVQKLATLVGKHTIARYLSYLDKHATLAERPEPEPTLHAPAGSVLGKGDIELFCNRVVPLIDPPDKTIKKLEAASYQLRLGSRCRVEDPKIGDSEGIVWLSDTKKYLHIPPHGIVIVSTYEWLNIPGCLIGRWNLKVRKVYEGLVWVGSLQVDPGYQGFLFCPIYNLSNREQILEYTDPLFIIDFVLTTAKEGKYEIWPLPQDRYSTFDFDRLDEQRIKSAPHESFDKQDKRIDDLKTIVENSRVSLESKLERSQNINLVFVSIIIAALAIVSAFGLGSVRWHLDWMPFAIAMFALAVSVIALFISFKKARDSKQEKKRDS